MRHIEAELNRLRQHVELPEPRDAAALVAARLRAENARSRWRRGRRALGVALCGAAAFASVALAVPAVRNTTLELFHLRGGVSVVRVDELPPLPVAGKLEPGRRVTLEQAQAAAPFALVAPRALGPPDEVYRSTLVPAGEVNFVYDTRSRQAVLISQFRRARPGRIGVEKLVAEATAVEHLRVNGRPAIWIGGPHLLWYRRPSATPGADSAVWLAGSVLIVELEHTLVRIELEGSKEQAVRIAESLEAL